MSTEQIEDLKQDLKQFMTNRIAQSEARLCSQTKDGFDSVVYEFKAVREEMKVESNSVIEQFAVVAVEFVAVRNDIKGLHDNIVSLQGDVTKVKYELSELRVETNDGFASASDLFGEIIERSDEREAAVDREMTFLRRQLSRR